MITNKLTVFGTLRGKSAFGDPKGLNMCPLCKPTLARRELRDLFGRILTDVDLFDAVVMLNIYEVDRMLVRLPQVVAL